MASDAEPELAAALPAAAREVEEFVASAGWEQPAQVFALVSTQQLLTSEPGLAEQLDPAAPLTPVAQDSLPAEDLSEALARIIWPDQVVGCALAQEIIVLPPSAESELPETNGDPEAARKRAAEHPDRREARLVAAVLRDGGHFCVMRLRATGDSGTGDSGMGDSGTGDEIIQDSSLAPNLVKALLETFEED